MADRKPTIAILTPFINWWYSNEVFKGIRSAAIERGVNLRFFSGGAINSPLASDRSKNEVYRMIGKQNADAVIVIAAALCEYLSDKEAADYFAGFSPLPVVGIGEFSGYIPQIVADNKTGMSSIISHLVEDHGYRKIAFVSGPLSNSEAVVRLNAYKEVLVKNGIEVDPDYIVYGNFTWPCSKALVEELLDRRKLDIEAFACANDDMAFGVYYELNNRKIDVPGRIALTGFDDVQEARYALPPFTTVKQPFYNQGREAVAMALDILEGKHKGKSLLLPAELVIRRSCGCNQEEAACDKKKVKKSVPRGKFDLSGLKEFSSDLKELLGERYSLAGKEIKKSIESLYLKLITGLEKNECRPFFTAVKGKVYISGVTEDLINRWQMILTLFGRFIRSKTDNEQLLDSLSVTINRTNELIEEIRNSIFGRSQVQFDMKAHTFQLTLEKIGSCLNLDDLLQCVRDTFRHAGLDCVYLSLYPAGQFGYLQEDLPIKEGRLLLDFDGEKIVVCPGDSLFPINDLVPGRTFQYEQNNHFIVYPITNSGYYFGIVIIEYQENKIKMYDTIMERLCATIWTIKQFNEIEDRVKKRTKELKEANEKLKELDSAKTDFFANISHELRTPLTLILSPLESLLAGDYGETISTGHNTFRSMHTNSVRLLRMINTLLDFSKLEAGRMGVSKKKTNINKLLNFYISSIHSGVESKGLTIEFIDHTQNLFMPLDRDLIEKAFFNLISNAMKFSPPGGKITVELTADEEQLQIRVQDRGIGIPADKLETIFERFTQVESSASRKYEGTGIGLAFTREIVELHQGTIWVESEMEKGSTFIINFPGSAVTVNEENRGAGQKGSPGDIKNNGFDDSDDFHEIKSWLTAELARQEKRGRRGMPGGNEGYAGYKKGQNENREYILIVDDNSNMRDFLKNLLGKRYTIRAAEHGKQALEIIAEKLPDLIISDVMMPEMNGMELCAHLKEHTRTAHIPLILLTARMDITTRIEGLEQKADDYLLKPFNARELFARIKNLLDKRQLELDLEAANNALWSEMETAKQIQTALLPKNPLIPGFDIACFIQSASEVSGDYYDIIRAEDKTWLVIGDVSGHGITAGLVMMMVQTAISTILYNDPDITPARLLSAINRVIKNNITKLGQEKYMTIIAFSLIESRKFMFSGLHQDIMIYRAVSDTVQVLESRGMWIGFIDDISRLVQNDTFEMESGDTILLYTDGITEAVKKDARPGDPDKRFGRERLLEVFTKNGPKPPEQIKKVLIDELEHYVCNDDFTFVIVQSK